MFVYNLNKLPKLYRLWDIVVKTVLDETVSASAELYRVSAMEGNFSVDASEFRILMASNPSITGI